MKLLLMAAGVVITCLVITVASQLAKTGKSDTQKATDQYDSVVSGYNEVNLTIYEGETSSGTNVVEYLKMSFKELAQGHIYKIKVVTKGGTNAGNQTYSSGNTEATLKETLATYQKAKTSDNYINLSGEFTCTITRNANEMIEEVLFTQQ